MGRCKHYCHATTTNRKSKQGTYKQKRKEEETHSNASDDEGLEWLDIVPMVEWWDAPLLCVTNDYASGYKTEMVTDLVCQPLILRPEQLRDGAGLNPDDSNCAVPMFLTKKERKKMKRIKKKEEHEQKTDEIRLGLREPPEPRLKISNVMRVLGDAAIHDPTAAESIAKAQMWKRKLKHELHNATNQLNPTERREKKKKKLQEDTSKEVHVGIFVVFKLFGKLNKGKICLNAQQRNLTGALIQFNVKELTEEENGSGDADEQMDVDEESKECVDSKVDVKKKNFIENEELSLNMVIVEGGPKGISKFERLLLHRIKWENEANCQKIWSGTVAKRCFVRFHQKKIKYEYALKAFLKSHHVMSYWDMLKNSPAVSRICA